MNQVWNIFRKDARHHWPEIAASLVLLVTFAWLDIRSWSQPDRLAAGGDFSFLLASSFLPGLLNALYPLSWVFLIVRLVQGESLVGDRQFWVTRPYDWKKLLAAKALFVLTFINFPLFCMEVFLLARSGFHPTQYIVGLLWMQMMWTFLLFLSVTAIAAVTSGIPQMLLALLLLLLYFIGMSALSAVIPNANFSAGRDWTGLLLLGTWLTVILVQYARRKTALSRWLITGVCGVSALILMVTPYKSLIARQYPLSRGDLPVQLSLMSPEKHDGHYVSRPPGSKISVIFPLKVSGLSRDFFLELNGMAVTLDNSSGLHWDSGWHSQRQNVFPDAATLPVSFEIEPDIFDQLKSALANMHLLMAFTLYHDQNQRQFVVPSNEFNLDGVGLCSSIQYSKSINCRAALRRPSFLLVASETATSTCPLHEDQAPPPPGRLARGLIRGGDSAAEMGISPIRKFEIFLWDWDTSNKRFTSPGICPGTPLVLSNPEINVRRRVELHYDNLSVNEYAQTSSDASGVILRSAALGAP